MSREYSRAFYKSKAWQACRKSYIAERQRIDGGMCEICKAEPGYIVHHKRHITPGNINDPDVTLSHDNLQYLCKDCHDKIHRHCGKDEVAVRYVFDDEGNPVPIT
jgi:hypothetical protein